MIEDVSFLVLEEWSWWEKQFRGGVPFISLSAWNSVC